MSRFDEHIRDLGDVPREAILSVTQKIAVTPHLWASNETKFSTDFKDTEHIVFKFPDDYPRSHLRASYKKLWGEWKSLLAPIIEGVVKNYGFVCFETSKVMFTRLNPHGRILRHVDSNPSSIVPHKIHVPLITNPNVLFHVDDIPYHLKVGRAYELNNLLPHSVENHSDYERVHFIFDCYPTGGEGE
jgi:hypothetical protein